VIARGQYWQRPKGCDMVSTCVIVSPRVKGIRFMAGIKIVGLVLAAGLCLSPALARAADKIEHGFLNRVYREADGKTSKYVVFVPHSYQGQKAYPLILFLHGLGESGSDGRKQVAVGLGPAIKKSERAFGFIAVFPQSQKRSWQASSEDGQRALGILDEVTAAYRVDAKRVYLTGLSMGGYGTWSLAAKYPDKWAAIAPVCGGGNPENAERIKNIPCWCFHGSVDASVNVEKSRQMIAALKAVGAKPKYTEYPGVGHKCWDKAYGTPELYTWFLEHHIN
jgi:predicted peptidase